MRIAQVICAGSFGGAEAVATALTRALIDLDERCVLYVVRELRAGVEACDELLARIQKSGLTPRVFDTATRFSPRLAHALVTSLKADGVELVHAHAYKIAAQALLLERRAGLGGTVFTIHGDDQSRWRGRLFLAAANVAGLYASRRTICVARAIHERLSSYPGLGPRLVTIPNAAPPSPAADWSSLATLRRAARGALEARGLAHPGELLLLGAGRLVPVKNFALMISAVAALARRGLPVRLLVAGEGPLRDDLAGLVAATQAPVTLLGQLAELAPYYLGADALLVSSDREGSPMVVLEAMAHGTPVIARAVGGIADLLRHGHEGVLIDAPPGPDRPEHLADAIASLSGDPARRERLGQAAWVRASSDLTTRAWALRHRALYRELARSG